MTSTAVSHARKTKSPVKVKVETLSDESPEEIIPEQRTIKVRVYRDSDDGNRLKIDVNGDTMPICSAVLSQLTVTQQRLCKKYSGSSLLINNIASTENYIPFSDWADAIVKAIQIRVANESASDPESNAIETTVTNLDPYMAVGGMLYKLQPVQMIKENAAIAVLKQNVLTKAKAAAKSITDTANITAQSIMDNANKARAEAAETLRNANRQVGSLPPQWALDNGVPLKVRKDGYSLRVTGWEFAVTIPFIITHFDIDYGDDNGRYVMTYSWDAKSVDHIRYVTLWLPVGMGGEFNQQSVKVDNGSLPALPHITSGSSCMTIGDINYTINSYNAFNSLVNSIKRVIKRVNLSSLLSGLDSSWLTMRDFMPDELQQAVRTNRDSGGLYADSPENRRHFQLYSATELARNNDKATGQYQIKLDKIISGEIAKTTFEINEATGTLRTQY